MAETEEGWPLGLRPLNSRVALTRTRDLSGSISFSTLLTISSTSFNASSSDLDTQSTGSFFAENTMTLGSLIGISSIIEVSRRSVKRRTMESRRDERNCRRKSPCFFSLCSKLNNAKDLVTTKRAPPSSLAQFLEAERKAAAATNRRRKQSLVIYGSTEYSPLSQQNPLFINSQIVPQAIPPTGRRCLGELLEDRNVYGAPIPLSCPCVNNLIK